MSAVDTDIEIAGTVAIVGFPNVGEVDARQSADRDA